MTSQERLRYRRKPTAESQSPTLQRSVQGLVAMCVSPIVQTLQSSQGAICSETTSVISGVLWTHVCLRGHHWRWKQYLGCIMTYGRASATLYNIMHLCQTKRQ